MSDSISIIDHAYENNIPICPMVEQGCPFLSSKTSKYTGEKIFFPLTNEEILYIANRPNYFKKFYELNLEQNGFMNRNWWWQPYDKFCEIATTLTDNIQNNIDMFTVMKNVKEKNYFNKQSSEDLYYGHLSNYLYDNLLSIKKFKNSNETNNIMKLLNWLHENNCPYDFPKCSKYGRYSEPIKNGNYDLINWLLSKDIDKT
jgi:hypothetical protein